MQKKLKINVTLHDQVKNLHYFWLEFGGNKNRQLLSIPRSLSTKPHEVTQLLLSKGAILDTDCDSKKFTEEVAVVLEGAITSSELKTYKLTQLGGWTDTKEFVMTNMTYAPNDVTYVHNEQAFSTQAEAQSLGSSFHWRSVV